MVMNLVVRAIRIRCQYQTTPPLICHDPSTKPTSFNVHYLPKLVSMDHDFDHCRACLACENVRPASSPQRTSTDVRSFIAKRRVSGA
jgi:hypothetical protein